MTSVNRNRIVVLIDMDCFFCQVETKLQPEFAGKPLAVVQYNQWELGGIIAVNYEAREYGVTRHMRGKEAKEKCPDIVLASVPCLRGKADTSRYRVAGREVIDVIKKHCNIIERASVDEAYLDITDIVDARMSVNTFSSRQLAASLSNTFVVGYSEIGKNDEEERSKGIESWISNVFEELEDVEAQKLAVAGIIVEELRSDIFETTGYRCSAGIAQNKILAKLACGLHKPNRQTILPSNGIAGLYSKLPVKKVRNLGGKFGDVIVESLNCNVMGDLLQYSLEYLLKRFDEKTGLWLYNIARGVDNEPVTVRLVSKSIGACKKFPGRQAIVSSDVLKHWAGELSAEVCERLEQDLEENERRATLLTISYHYYQNKKTICQSRSCALSTYNPERMANRCVEIVTNSTQCPVAYLGISAGKFVQIKGSSNFMNFFKANKTEIHDNTNIEVKNNQVEHPNILTSTEETVDYLKTNVTTCTFTNTDERSNVKIVESGSTSKRKRLTGTPKSSIKTCNNNSNTTMGVSPTSKRVNNLIQSLSKRTNAKTPYSDIGNYNVNESLDQEKFKGSFFMNIFNPKENKADCVQKSNDIELETLNDNKDFDIQCEDGEQTECSMVKNELHINYENVTHDQQCATMVNLQQEENCIQPSTSSGFVGENNTIVAACEEEKNSVTEIYTVRLEDIFPDLNNIDSDIIPLLPLNLQKEAKLYMKGQRKPDAKTTDNSTKCSKSKSNKSRTKLPKERGKNSISTFLTKGNTDNSIGISSKLCTQCHQMIALSKYDEHRDFHMAENLQRELNNPSLNNENIKRKLSSDMNTATVKRRPNVNDLKPHKNYKPITAFLS